MRRFFAMMRYSKKLLISTICLVVDICVTLAFCIFDIVQLIQITRNSAAISSSFVTINIVLISLMVLNLIGLVVYIIIRRNREKHDEFKQS